MESDSVAVVEPVEPEPRPPKICPFCRIPLPLAFDCTLCGRWKETSEQDAAANPLTDPRKGDYQVKGRPLPDLAAELKRQADAKQDFVVPAQSVRIRSNGRSDIVLSELYELNDIAHQQMAEYTGIPKPFYDRLRGTAEDLRLQLWYSDDDMEGNVSYCEASLFDTLLNKLLHTKGKDGRLVRTLDGKARAFLSDSFNVDLDNYDVFAVAARVIEEQGLGPDNVISAEVTERKLYIKVVSPKVEATIEPSNLHRAHGGHHFLKEPQVVQAGFIISNSEVGLGSLSVQQVVYKLVCTNLAIVETAYRQRHLGKVLEADQNGHVYRSDTRTADAKAKLLKVRDHVADALDEHRFAALVGKMQETTEIRLEGRIETVVEGTARRFGLSPTEKDEVLKNLIEGADLSAWGLANAVTATAHSARSYDRATELETVGGRLMTLPFAEMRELTVGAPVRNNVPVPAELN